MKKLKQILLSFPEYYLVVLVLLSGYTPPFYINPIFIGIALILILQIIFKSKTVGIVIAALFMAGNLFMMLALISEFQEFPSFTANAAQLLFVGFGLIFFNFFIVGIMAYKYLYKDDKATLLLS